MHVHAVDQISELLTGEGGYNYWSVFIGRTRTTTREMAMINVALADITDTAAPVGGVG